MQFGALHNSCLHLQQFDLICSCVDCCRRLGIQGNLLIALPGFLHSNLDCFRKATDCILRRFLCLERVSSLQWDF